VQLDGISVLVIDDDVAALELFEAVLTDAHARVLTATSVFEALRALRTARPHVIVSDIDMPGCDGYQLMRMVRGRTPEEGGATPAIAVTGYTRPEDQTRALLAGYQVHLAKPIKPLELILTIKLLATQSAG
jgi:CheY-like chemotaxis protein